MLIPATLYGETVYIVAFLPVMNGQGWAVCIRPNGSLRIASLDLLTVLPYAEDEFIGTSFVPPAPDAD